MRRRPAYHRLVLAVLSGTLATTALAAPARAACPNEAVREAQGEGVTALPGCMALEMVSPPKKFVQAAFEPSFSLDGERVLFRSMAGLANTPGLHNPFGDRYVASRVSGGWSTAPTSAPTSAMITNGATSWKGGAVTFSPDLSRWSLLGTTQWQEQLGIGQAFQGGLDGSFAPLSPVLEPINNDPTGNPESQTIFVLLLARGASVDSSSLVFEHLLPSASYFPEDPRGGGGSSGTNSYVAALRDGAPSLALLARDKSGKAYGGRCGTDLGGAGASLGGNVNQGAVSADGSRIYFTTRPAQPDSIGTSGPPCNTSNPLRIMRRLETPSGPEVSELLPGGPSEPGDDLYQGASLDGTKVYFTSPRDLAASDADVSAEPCSTSLGSSKGCDLYLYDSTLPEGSRVIQVSAGGAGDPTPGQGANVLSSITALSGDGSHVYFVAQGVLTTDPNPEGDFAVEGQPNLYAYSRDSGSPSGQTAFVGMLAGGPGGDTVLWSSEGSFRGDAYAVPLLGPSAAAPEEGGDGHVLVFASGAPLTSGDDDLGHRDVFRYDSTTDALGRISEAAPGGSDDGSFDVSVNPNEFSPMGNFAGEGRWVSEDGETVAFFTDEPLTPGDADGVANPYFWRAGELGRVAGAIPPNGFPRRPPTVSLDGDQVAFTVIDPLLPQDTDTASDAYVARVDGGFLPPPLPPICIASVNCQAREPQPAFTPPASGAPTAGNVQEKRCKKGFVEKRGKCVKKSKKRSGKGNGKSRRGAGG